MAAKQKSSRKHSKRYDIILITAIIVIAIIVFFVYRYVNRQPSTLVDITINREEYATLDLSKDTTLTITNPFTESENLLVIEDGKAYMAEASCPDHVCVYQGEISTTGQMIICLPNMVIVEIISAEDTK